MHKITLISLDNDFLQTINNYKKIHLKPHEGTYYTISVNNARAGVIGFKLDNNGKHHLKIGIHQNFRGQGIFESALDLLAKKHKIDTIYSEVAIANRISVKAHEKIGFTRISKKEETVLKKQGLLYKRNMMMVKIMKVTQLS